MAKTCPARFGSRTCGTNELRKKAQKIVFPSEQVGGAGWLTKKWWNNGSFTFNVEGKEYWKLCLERKGQENVGYNAVVTVGKKRAKGLVWKDTATQNCTSESLTEAIEKSLSQ